MARSPSNKGITNRNTNVPPAGRNYQDQSQAVRRIPGVAYGEQQDLIEQQKASPLPVDTIDQTPPRPRRSMPQVDIFSPTQRPSEPVTAGLPFGPGATAPEQLENTNDIIYEMYRLTGDSYLLNLIEQ
jgi:hypothetical protein